MKVNRVNIGLRIEQRLNELNISKAEFGRLIGIPQQNVNRILDRTNIDTDKLADISEVLNYNFFYDFVPSDIISADHGGIAAGGSVSGSTTLGAGSTVNNYNESCTEDKHSLIVKTLTESVATLTRELMISQEQKSNLINIIDKLTNR